MAQQTTDYATAFKAMAEQAADTSIKNTAEILAIPFHQVHRYLDEKGLRLLCISVAHEAMALYTKQQLTDAESDRAERQEPEHPGC